MTVNFPLFWLLRHAQPDAAICMGLPRYLPRPGSQTCKSVSLVSLKKDASMHRVLNQSKAISTGCKFQLKARSTTQTANATADINKLTLLGIVTSF